MQPAACPGVLLFHLNCVLVEQQFKAGAPPEMIRMYNSTEGSILMFSGRITLHP